MFKGLFKKTKYITVSRVSLKDNFMGDKPSIPDGLWFKCSVCGEIMLKEDVQNNLEVCLKCNKHFRIAAFDRMKMIADENSFEEFDKNMKSVNPIDFKGYEKKLKEVQTNTDMIEAVITGKCTIKGEETIIGIMDSNFLMGSMGSVVGEKITRAFEKATLMKLPVVIFTASGGARMQEGIFSLMQMAKVSAAIKKFQNSGGFYLTVLTDPTTGGVTASFASLGDIILSEPNTLIGFAGRRVIEQTIKEKLSEEFQSSEFLLEHGFIDMIVQRKELKENIAFFLNVHGRNNKWKV